MNSPNSNSIFQIHLGMLKHSDMSGRTYFPRKFCPTGQDILSASRIICPWLGGKSVQV